MQICHSVNAIPPHQRKSKFMPVWKALMFVQEGKYLPVICATVGEAGHLKQECTRRNLTAERRDKTVYIEGVSKGSLSIAEIEQEPTIVTANTSLTLDSKPNGSVTT